MRYADFEYHALEYFGLVGDEVATLLDLLGGSVRGIAEDDEDFWVQASEALDSEALGLFEIDEPYALDSLFPDDEYLDPYEEWEMTAESIEGYGEDM